MLPAGRRSRSTVLAASTARRRVCATTAAVAAVTAITLVAPTAGASIPVVSTTTSSAPAASIDLGDPRSLAGTTAEPYTFVSTPDLFNTDLGSVKRLPTYRGGPDSWNATYARSVRHVLDTMAAERPQDVLVAGDLVEGHWGIDTRNTRTFGPVGSTGQRTTALKRAARFYYREWRDRFDARGLTVHAALGDHEIGDNPWRGQTRTIAFKRKTVALRKRLFADTLVRSHHYPTHPKGPASRTAYAELLAPEVLMVTVDVFDQTDRDVRIRLDHQQLRWLDQVLAFADRAGVDWVMVQGHTPVLGPVPSRGSSDLFVERRARSPFWRTMARHDVDLYLSGEVHETSVTRADGITQIAHGGLFGFGLTSYLLGQVQGPVMGLQVKDFRTRIDKRTRLWQTDTSKSPPGRVHFGAPRVRGSLLLSADGSVLSAAGKLRPR